MYPKKTSKKKKHPMFPNLTGIFKSLIFHYGPFIVTQKAAFVQELLVSEGSGTEPALTQRILQWKDIH